MSKIKNLNYVLVIPVSFEVQGLSTFHLVPSKSQKCQYLGNT